MEAVDLIPREKQDALAQIQAAFASLSPGKKFKDFCAHLEREPSEDLAIIYELLCDAYCYGYSDGEDKGYEYGKADAIVAIKRM